MSYQALYRKYRPSSLEDVIGQDVVIKILKNAVINDKVGHAYLFSGPRGIGKTSIAKIFAKTVNCLKPKDGTACGKCDNCKTIDEGFCPDIIEIDAASNNGVDEIREIKNKVNLVPNQLKYKVYIIDEVHMLSIGAFNALLKTLEEPPEHIIFILATTDPQKVPATVVSRCQCFEFHRISNEQIVERLNYVCEKEKIKLDDDVLDRIAILADGGLRDAIGMLDKLNAYSSSKITLEDFEKVNGIVSIEDKENFIKYVENKDVTKFIKFIDNIYNNGKDLIIFTQDLIRLVKDKMIGYYVNNDSYDIDFLLSFSKTLNDLLNDIKLSSNVKTLFEINLLAFMNHKPANMQPVDKEKVVVEKIEQKVEKTEEKQQVEEEIPTEKENIVDTTESVAKEDFDYSELNKQIINNTFARADKKLKQMFDEKWKTLSDYALDSKYGAVASFLTDGTARVVGENEVIISFAYESMVNRGFNLIEKVQKLFEMVYNIHYDVAFVTEDEWNNIKSEFIENKNKGITYEYVEIDKNLLKQNIKKENDNSITSQAVELFGEDVVSV